MKPPRNPLRPGLFLAALLAALSVFTGRAQDPLAWPPITAQTKPWAFWWWMGSAVDKTNLTKELTRYQAAGLGGVHIIPIYGARGYESKYLTYLSPQWMEMMGWSVSEARRLGMDVDMTTGTGWCFGGPQITDEDANASVVVKTYPLAAGQTLTQTFDPKSTQALVAYSPEGKATELTDTIDATGHVAFSPASGTWTVYAISQKPSGQKVKRAAPGGEGWMLNLFYPQAVDDFLKPFTAAFDNYTGPKPRAQFQDSYEYRSDWSPVFFAEFEKRRGYRLQDELPALFSQNPDDHAARVLCDYRQTVSEIMAQESLPKWTQWAHDHGFITRDQAHGSPGNWLDLYSAADIPETEMFHLDRNCLVSKFASSAAHVNGKPLVSSETGTWLEEHFTEKLSDLKYLFDDMFLSGINHMFYHGLCYSPDEAGWPGWHFYASTEMNPRNAIWHDADALNAYAARCQSILQSGKPDNDVLLYWPIEDYWMQPGGKMLPQLTVAAHDWFVNQPIGATAHDLWNRGYAFDYISDDQLAAGQSAIHRVIGTDDSKYVIRKIELPGGNYGAIIVPECQYLPVKTLKQLIAFADTGIQVMFMNQLPIDASGASAADRAEFKTLLAKLKPGTTALNVPFFTTPDGGTLLIGTAANQWPSHLGVKPETMVAQGLSCVRRSFDGGWHYFIANKSGTNFDGWITLARPAKSIEIMDPMTGATGMAAQNADGRIHLELAPGQSLILRAFVGEASGPAWTYWQANGASTTLAGDWNVKFIDGGPTLPADYQTTALASWTTFPDTNTLAFAGTARYETTFDAPAGGSSFYLDLGDVRQSAHVWVNGRDYGKLLIPPFRLALTDLKPTGNQLVVEVTSVTANRIRDLDRRGVKWKAFRDINIVDVNYKPFDASNWPITDCGLLGPVTLTRITGNNRVE